MADSFVAPTGGGQAGLAPANPATSPTVDLLAYWKAGAHEIKTFRGHSQGIWTVAYAPDGLTLISGGADRLVRIWDVETGRLLRSLRGHTHDIRAAVFTPDGQTLATGSEDRTIRLWNPKTGEPTKLLFTRYDHNVCSLSLSPDGLMLARGSHNKDIKIWEITTGTELMTLLGKDQYDHHWTPVVAFSPDGIHLASGSDIGKIKIWEVLPSGEEKVLHNGHWLDIEDDDSTEYRGYFVEDEGGFQKPMNYWIGAITFTPDGRTLITGSRDCTIKFFEMPQVAEIRTLKGHGGWVRSLVVSPDGKVLASASDDQTIKLWEIATGRTFRTLKAHAGAVRGLAFSPDGLRLASASWDKTVKLWEGGTEPA
ncbi:MAG: WD40 repeat domain-containing protein [Nitrospira sp.]|nr:WD40 repeat domain-containing protein [Nitrospira sp.]